MEFVDICIKRFMGLRLYTPNPTQTPVKQTIIWSDRPHLFHIVETNIIYDVHNDIRVRIFGTSPSQGLARRMVGLGLAVLVAGRVCDKAHSQS